MKGVDVDFEDMKTGFMSGKTAALADWSFRREQKEFGVLVNRLRVKKWAKENPQRRREIANRYAKKPDVVARQVERERHDRHQRMRETAEVFTCIEPDCAAQWCRVPGTWRGGLRPLYCSNACFQRNRYQRKTPGARRIKRRRDG